MALPSPLQEELTQQLTALEHKLAREQHARTAAEQLLEEKSRELFFANEQLKSNQAHMMQNEKMASLGQLAAGIAHEINNPLGYTVSNLGVLADYIANIKIIFSAYFEASTLLKTGKDNDALQALKDILSMQDQSDVQFIMDDIDQLLPEKQDGLERVKEIVQNLKSFARLDESAGQVVDLHECIEAALKIAWNELKYKCQVTRAFGKLPKTYCFPGELNQVFLNLFVNAAQAMDNLGEIVIETRSEDLGDGHWIVAKVRDNGSGIPEEKLTQIFDPFFTTKPVGQGTGLGLSISYGIVQKHGGTITVDSTVGVGTTFTIRLPVKKEPEKPTLGA